LRRFLRFKKTTYSRLYKHIYTYKLLIKEFKFNSSIDAASYIVINEILINMNNRLSGRGILCDLENVLDCADRGIVVDKLDFISLVFYPCNI